MQEVLVVVAIALAIFFLPRVMGRKSAPEPEPDNRRMLTILTGRMRLSILTTVFWIAGSAAFLKPWEGKTILFLYVGLVPVLALWGAFWVWVGYKKYRR
jgi:hypothetical protein